MDRLQQTTCALATPAGEGGIAVVRVSGPDAYPLVEKVFVPLCENRRLADACGSATLAHYFFAHRGDGRDHRAVFPRAALLYGRGRHRAFGAWRRRYGRRPAGSAAAGRGRSRHPPPGEFTSRVLEHGRLSLTQAETVMEVIAANGRQGAALRHGVDCVLLNLLAGFDRAIVTPVAGTTRDVVEQAVQLGEIRLNLFDTTGVHGEDEADAIEAEGIRRSWEKLDETGLVLAVFNAAQLLTEADLDIARRCQGRPALAILNKQDLTDTTAAAQTALQPYFKQVLPLCARDDASLPFLRDAVAALLGAANGAQKQGCKDKPRGVFVDRRRFACRGRLAQGFPPGAQERSLSVFRYSLGGIPAYFLNTCPKYCGFSPQPTRWATALIFSSPFLNKRLASSMRLQFKY